MAMRERVLEWMGGVSRDDIDAIESRAYEAGYMDGNDEPPSGELKSYGYKQISGGAGRELSVTHEKAIQTAWKLWQSSLIANRSLSLKRDYILDRGVMPSAPDSDDLQEIFDKFTKSNKWNRRQKEFVKQLFGFGEQCYPVFVRESDGAVTLGYIDPEEIHDVICHPENALEQWAVVIKESKTAVKWGKDNKKRVYRIVRATDKGDKKDRLVTWQQAQLDDWEAIMLREYELTEYSGSCFYEGVNRVSNQPRGFTDLLQATDYIDQTEASLWSMLDREQFAGYFSFDVTLANADKTAVSARAKELRNNPPAKGSVNVHNDSEHWQMHAPDLKQQGSVAGYKGGLGHVLGGLGYPLHWYGFGDDANRATATAQGQPTEKSLSHDQGIVKDLFTLIFTFVRDQAIIAGYLKVSEDDETIVVDMPEISKKDVSVIVSGLVQLASALQAAVDSDWITNRTAATIYHKALSELDVEINTDQELKDAEAEADEREEKQVGGNNDMLNNLFMANAKKGDNGD